MPVLNFGQVLVFATALILANSPSFAQQRAPEPKAGDAKTGYTFPQKIGIAQLANVEDFEAKDPGLGQVGQYTFQGWRMSMYVYDKRRTDLADTPNPAQIKSELDLSVADIQEAKKLGHYARIDEGAAFAMPPTAQPPIFQCRTFVIRLAAKPGVQPQPPYDSYMCVTTSRKKFVKLRLSSTTPTGDQATVFVPVVAAIEMVGRMLQRP